jgi:hypothetical protein
MPDPEGNEQSDSGNQFAVTPGELAYLMTVSGFEACVEIKKRYVSVEGLCKKLSVSSSKGIDPMH